MRKYGSVFKPTEICMMLAAFSNMETVHIAAYSAILIDTLGLPEVEYTAFLKYKEMKDKYDYMQEFGVESTRWHRQDAGRVRRVYGRAAVVCIIRHPDELPALRQDEGHGADRGVERCGMNLCTPTRSSKLYRTFLWVRTRKWRRRRSKKIFIRSARPLSIMRMRFIELAFGMGEVEGTQLRRRSRNISASSPTAG